MKYIRSRTEEKTCYQEAASFSGAIDFGNDFVCVYGIDPTMPERIRQFQQRGYVIHLMTGIAWGDYQDYMSGGWDGRPHWDENQRSRDGSITGEYIHSTGYMVPTIAFTDYITEKLKIAVDHGVEAVHLEEPEFLNDGGYSEAFKREYLLYYHEPWVAPHESVDAHYRAARLKVYLYKRAIERISTELRDYAMIKYHRVLRFYIPTHSLLNYAQWKVLSPEGTLTDIPSLAGYKAQVWMGTSREGNVYRGVYKERTFETAFLEYGIMQELVRGTERTMWFDNDPIEDNPRYDWDDYQKNYIETLVASLLQPHINRYQICPWPTRIFGPNAKYPAGSPDATQIPGRYATLLSNIFQMLGTFETDDFEYTRSAPNVGVFLSDSAMFQRDYPGLDERVIRKLHDETASGSIKIKPTDRDTALAFAASIAFPHFYGLTLPLLKGGLPVRPVQLENATRYPGYLNGYDLLVISYEFMKPAGAEVNAALATYVQDGGTLVYCGDGGDPFHGIRAWWNTGINHYASPLEHLLYLMNLKEDVLDGIYPYGKGRFVLNRLSPALLCLDNGLSQEYQTEISALLQYPLDQNHISLRRGPYTITAVMDECATGEPVVHKGLYADMLTTAFDIVRTKTVPPKSYAVLYDLNSIAEESLAIIGSSIRITELRSDTGGFTLTGCGPDDIQANIRLRLPKEPKTIHGTLYPLAVSSSAPAPQETAEDRPASLPVEHCWDNETGTVLISFDCKAGNIRLTGVYAQ